MALDLNSAGDALRNQMQQAIEKAAGDAAAQPDVPAGPPADADVQQFQAALGQAPETGTPAPDAPAAGGETAPAAGPESMGDRILKGITSAGERVQAGREEALSVLQKQDVGQADLLRANFALLESNTLVTAVSKTTEKTTQGLKTLQQG